MREGESLSLGRYGTATLIQSPADPAVDPVEFEFELGPGAPGPPPHFHPAQEERWEVLEGSLDARVGERALVLSAESVSIPAGTIHNFRNRTNRPVRFRDIHRPGRGFQAYVEELASILADGAPRDPRTLLRLAQLLESHVEDQRAASPFLSLGQAAGAAAARLFRLT